MSEPTPREQSPAPGSTRHGDDGVTRRRGTVPVLTAVLGALALAALALFGGYRLGVAQDGAPAQDGADVGFARDMAVHHRQAVEMAMIIRDKTSDPALRTLADDIASTQNHQAGQMYGWLTLWGYPSTNPDPMAWMSSAAGHAGHGAPATAQSQASAGAGPAASASPAASDSAAASGDSATAEPDPMTAMGMATADQIAALKAATGQEAERQFLTLMIAHHHGGVDMAEATLERADETVVLDLARGIVAAQTNEIAVLEGMLAERS